MASREDISKALLDCLKEVASLLLHAKEVAHKQQKALVDNDAEMIVLSTRAQEGVLRRVGEADQRAAALGADLAEAAGLGSDVTDSDAIASAASYPYTGLIKLEMDRISELADAVQRENEVCTVLLKNGLDIIACCLRTLASESGPNAYGRTASLYEPQASVLSLDRKA